MKLLVFRFPPSVSCHPLLVPNDNARSLLGNQSTVKFHIVPRFLISYAALLLVMKRDSLRERERVVNRNNVKTELNTKQCVCEGEISAELQSLILDRWGSKINKSERFSGKRWIREKEPTNQVRELLVSQMFFYLKCSCWADDFL